MYKPFNPHSNVRQGRGDPDWESWSTDQVRQVLRQNRSHYFEAPLCEATLRLIRDEVFATSRLDDPRGILRIIDNSIMTALSSGRIIEISNAYRQGWAQSKYQRSAAYDQAVYSRGIEERIHLDSAPEWSALIDYEGSAHSWALNAEGEIELAQEQHAAFDAKERARLIAELTANGTKGFSVLVPVGDSKSGWTTKRVAYDAQGHETKPDLMGVNASGRVPRKGDDGFEAMTTERIRELAESVRAERKFSSMSKTELVKATKDLRAGQPMTFGAEMVQQQRQQNDDFLFHNDQGMELTRAEIYKIAKNDLPRFRKLINRDADRVNRILGAR